MPDYLDGIAKFIAAVSDGYQLDREVGGREAAPAELIAELAASAEGQRARPLPAGATQHLQAVLAKVPAEAARFEIVALPGV